MSLSPRAALLLLMLLLPGCGRFSPSQISMPSMPKFQMPQFQMPQMQNLTGGPVQKETPAEVAARIKPLLHVKDVKPTSLHAINVSFSYDGNDALKRLVLEAYYNDDVYTADITGPLRPDTEFVARFKDSRIDTYNMNFAALSWAVKEAEEYEQGTYKNYYGGGKPVSRYR